MAEETLHLYHCARCGELFRSKLRLKEDIRCEVCGEHPLAPKFQAFSEAQDANRIRKKKRPGASRKEDVRNHKNQKRQSLIQWLLTGILCIGILSFAAHKVIKMYQHSKIVSQGNEEVNAEERAFLALKDEAFTKCKSRFEIFNTESVIHTKSSHVYRGAGLITDMKLYYQNNMVTREVATLKMMDFELLDDDKHTKAIGFYRYQADAKKPTNSYDIEVLFRKSGKDWLIDWSDLVRIGDANWFKFQESKTLNAPKTFSLYLRNTSAESIPLKGYKEFRLSEAFNNSTLPSRLPKSAFIKNQTALSSKVSLKFKELEELESQTDLKKIGGRFDPKGMIRVVAEVAFEKIEGETVLVIKEISQLNWETPKK